MITARLVDGLDHVDHGEAGDRDGGERLHLDAGAVGGRDRGHDVDRLVGDDEVEGDRRQRERVAQRDQRRRLLGAHDPGQPRHGEGVALRHAGAAEQRDDGRRDEDAARCGRRTRRHCLAGDVDHPGRAGVVDVGEGGHQKSLVQPEHLHHVARRQRGRLGGYDDERIARGEVAEQVRAVPADRGHERAAAVGVPGRAHHLLAAGRRRDGVREAGPA